jgi:transcriptional regulator with XRE-family HTH domain
VTTDSSTPATSRTFAQKLDHLFRTIHPGNRGEYTYDEVAQGIQEIGESISGAYVWMLRTGRRGNPTMRHVRALARFFGVSPVYFFDDAEAAQIDTELDVLAALRDAGVRRIALRASVLQPNLQAAVGDLIDRLLESQESAQEQPPMNGTRDAVSSVDTPTEPPGDSHT